MHIAVRQGVDKINSLQADSLLSQELDLELNKSMMKFINLKYGRNNIYGKGFEQSQKRIDDLSTLVSEYRGFTGFVDREKLAYYKSKFLYREFFSLPYDYMYHLESSCNVLRTKACKSSEFQLEYFNDADYTANTAYEDESKVLFIPFSYLKLSGGYQVNLTISGGVEYTGAEFDAADTDNFGSGGDASILKTIIWDYATSGDTLLPVNATNITDEGHIYRDYIIEHILTNHSEDVDIFWENAGKHFKRDTFIVVVRPNSHLYSTVRTPEETNSVVGTLQDSPISGFTSSGVYTETWGSVEYHNYAHLQTVGAFGRSRSVEIESVNTDKIIGYKRIFKEHNTDNTEDFSYIEEINDEFEGVNMPIKYVQHDDIHALLRDPFNRPTVFTTLGLFTSKRLELFSLSDSASSATTIPDSVKIKYLRTPRPISLGNNIDCELPQHTHEEIVEMTISSLLEEFSDPRYKTHLNELNKNE